MSSSDYHGKKPITDDDKKMAKEHLKSTKKLIKQKHDLLEDKITDHKKALIQRLKDGNKPSADYNRSHMVEHQKDLATAHADQDKIYKSIDTLSKLHTHSRKTYNDVRKAKVNLMYAKAGANK